MRFRISVKAFLISALFCYSVGVYSQISHSGIPVYNPKVDTFFVPFIDIDIPDILGNSLIKSKSESKVRLKDNEFAIPVDVSINPYNNGVWKEYGTINKKIWLLGIRSKNARSLNVLFDSYQLVPGVKLFIYNEDQTKVLGAFTYRNNKKWKSLAISQIYADTIYIEMQMPLTLTSFGSLNIGQIGVEKKSLLNLKSTEDQYYNWSESCEVNVNCYKDKKYQDQKQSVCRIVFNGTSRCTGTLLNNLNNNGIPYVLTAAHCFTDNFSANSAVFTFNYESPVCENMDTNTLQSISGASIVSYTDNLDFLLLELSESVPVEYQPYYSGWDATGIAPTSTYTIHHPLGDIKKLTLNEDVATIKTFPGQTWDNNTHWFIADYELGSTEGGSSGSALYSQDNLVVGSLSGGAADCDNPVQEYYQMFSHSFSDYLNKTEQLKYWLDPDDTGLLTCQAYNPSLNFRTTAKILTNVLDTTSLDIINQDLGWGYLAGHNYQGNAMFAEYFKLNGSKYLYGANIDLPSKIFNDNEHKVIFTVWEGGNTPGKILYEYPVYLGEFDQEDVFIFDFDSTILVDESFYFGYQLDYDSDTFAVKSQEDVDNNTAYTYYEGEWQPLLLDGETYSSHLSIGVLAYDYLPEKGVLPDSSAFGTVNIYPNPSVDYFQVLFKEKPIGKITFNIYNLSGRVVYTEEFNSPDRNVRINHNLPGGVYILTTLVNDSKVATFKLLVR